MIHVHLSRDAEFLNRVVNDPSVFPGVCLGQPGPFDMAPFISDPRNYFFANEHGGFLVLNKGEGVYEIHTQFLPEGRGKSALLSGLEGMAYMFTQTDCVQLTTQCPHDNPASKRLSRMVGMRKVSEDTYFGVPCDVYSITRSEWLCQQQYQQS